ncbi:MAG: alpha-E domain-containing protein [Pirellulales bacterium]|nr:alpha-E domain-containing protein [Pirellulales bacterium]
MLSRVASCVYWMARYLERAEDVARFVEVNLQLTLDLAGSVHEQWEPLVFTTGDQEEFRSRYGTATQGSVVHFLTYDTTNPNSILSCLRYARENARAIREIIPTPVFEELNKFYWFVRDSGGQQPTEASYELFQQIKRRAQLIVGIEDATMSRGEAWHFAQLGRYLERADKTSRILDVKYYILLPAVQDVGTTLDVVQWSALLKSTGALEMYRKRWGRIASEHVVDFLVLDGDFPRAMRYCLIQAEQSLARVAGGPIGSYRNAAQRRLGQLRAELDFAQVEEIIDRGLHEFIDHFQTRLNGVGGAVHDAFFAVQPLEAVNHFAGRGA